MVDFHKHVPDDVCSFGMLVFLFVFSRFVVEVIILLIMVVALVI